VDHQRYAVAHVIGLSAINRTLNLIPKRAVSRQAKQLRDTFVDSGIATAVEAIDHQVLYGRRGHYHVKAAIRRYCG
jgi:hypothetical protein